MTATIHALPSAELQDIPSMLRKIAEAIEAGEYGDVTEAAVVTNGDEIQVFGLGRADGTVTHYLLACGQRRLEDPMLSD